MTTKLSQKIIELRTLGYSYNKIAAELKCSKGTVSYHIGDGQKDKSILRNKSHDKDKIVQKKIYKFCSIKKDATLQFKKEKTIQEILYTKIRKFGDMQIMFTPQDLIDKIGDNPTCYLTGRKIDLSDSKSYHLDHIVPRSKGGDNTLENCGIACKIANMSKTDMTYEEYVNLCREIIKHYEIAHTGNAPVSQP